MGGDVKSKSDNEYIAIRRRKAEELRACGINTFCNDVKASDVVFDIRKLYGEMDADTVKTKSDSHSIAGRIMAIRSFGKAAFLKIKDRTGDLQVFVQKQVLGDDGFALFKRLDVGDITYFHGTCFRTKTNELTLAADELKIVTKAYRPLPEKWHGLTDVETRYRQRYVDLIVNPQVKKTFEQRSKIIQFMREFLTAREFLEVETPMMHPIPGGATARPFVTHHNTLDMDLYLRIAPELYLKRLVVGGMERVFEINRNFRNEGMSVQHNPEFTMLEFYQTYANFEDLMSLTEKMFAHIVGRVQDSMVVTYQNTDISFNAPYARYTMKDAIVEIGGIDASVLASRENALKYASKHDIPLKSNDDSLGTIMAAIFDEIVQEKLIQPTFITHYPIDVSPLSRRNENDPQFVDRFELFMYGREIANGFSELNDPDDQAERFKLQVEALSKGDDEAMHYDADYINALEYGMPPTAGEGVGIDRLVMLLTDSPSIRDVILFPQLKSQK